MKKLLSWAIFVLSSFCVKAQTNAPAGRIPLSFEKVYLHTDRDVYAQGDTLWFKAYLVNAQDNKLTTSSGNLYVELLSPDSAKILVREIIRMESGLGNGDISLQDSLPPGRYQLRAYTNWMRNFGDNFVFEKSITILNLQASSAAAYPITAAIKRSKQNEKQKSGGVINNTNIVTKKLPIVRFYPEGGSLVEGISSKIATKAEDQYGSGISVSGIIVSSAGDTVSHFSCDSLGMGLFTLLPLKGQVYRAIVKFNPEAVFTLPDALYKGLTLQVKQTDSAIHGVVNSLNNEGLITAAANRPAIVNLMLKHKGKTLLNEELQLQGTQTAFKLETNTLPEGISTITIYNNEGKPECERLVYINHTYTANKLIINTDKSIYKPKEKVTVDISTSPNSSLSMAVVDANVVPKQVDDIVAYLNLQSEINGYIEKADRYFDTTNINRFKQLDLLLMTQGWRDFVWRRLADTAIRISYAAENGINISGKIRDEVLNKILPGLNITMYAPAAKGNKIFNVTSNSLGRFDFHDLMQYGKQTVTLSAVNEKGQKKGSFMVDTLLPLAGWPAKLITRKETGEDSIAIDAIKGNTDFIKNSKINGITHLKEVKIADKQNILTRNGELLTSFGPDQVFNIKPEDESYKTLEWYLMQNAKGVHLGITFWGMDTLREIIPRLTPNGGPTMFTYRLKMAPMPAQLFVNGVELYMGEPTQAAAYRIEYYGLPITKFKKIVIKHMVGTLHGFNALGGPLPSAAQILMVDRYHIYLTLDEHTMMDNPGFTNVEVTGYYQARTFYQPPPNAKPSPDNYRAIICWEPNIRTDTSGKAAVSFYNAVPQTNVRVIIQGITDSGEPLNAIASYGVKQ